ncbi:hypothetical protein LTR86_011099 [Recurvomyces mirabilis]|nr:hypothetical protein LTR86_011099 [Recurvomyces mirabilis]
MGVPMLPSYFSSLEESNQDIFRFTSSAYIFFRTALPWCAFVVMKRYGFRTIWDRTAADVPWLELRQTYEKCDLFGLCDLKHLIMDFVNSRDHAILNLRELHSTLVNTPIELDVSAGADPSIDAELALSETDGSLHFKRERYSVHTDVFAATLRDQGIILSSDVQ